MKTLTAEDVTFTIEVKSEIIFIRGNYVVSGDDAQDKADEDEILARLESGDNLAWCIVVVKARWKDFIGQDSMGGCSFQPNATQKDIDELVDEYGMKEAALHNLNGELAYTYCQLKTLL